MVRLLSILFRCDCPEKTLVSVALISSLLLISLPSFATTQKISCADVAGKWVLKHDVKMFGNNSGPVCKDPTVNIILSDEVQGGYILTGTVSGSGWQCGDGFKLQGACSSLQNNSINFLIQGNPNDPAGTIISLGTDMPGNISTAKMTLTGQINGKPVNSVVLTKE